MTKKEVKSINSIQCELMNKYHDKTFKFYSRDESGLCTFESTEVIESENCRISKYYQLSIIFEGIFFYEEILGTLMNKDNTDFLMFRIWDADVRKKIIFDDADIEWSADYTLLSNDQNNKKDLTLN